MGYIYIFCTIIFTVYGQVILKWRLNELEFLLPKGLFLKIFMLLQLLLDPYILSGFLSAFIASLFWMASMTKYEITIAYPFMSLSPVLVFIVGVLFLNETFTLGKVLGLFLISLGLFVTVKL